MRKHFRHKPVVLLLALCCLTALVGGTYAAYTYPTSGQVKRVVSAQTGAVATAQQFSSNYLKEKAAQLSPSSALPRETLKLFPLPSPSAIIRKPMSPRFIRRISPIPSPAP